MTIPISKLEAAAPTKPQGWLTKVMGAGVIAGSNLSIGRGAWLRVCAGAGQWGDVVAVVANPVSKALRIKPDCGGCKARAKLLNRGGEPI